ncbi:uncharacterized protein [Aegilops tauschii subsp. strangulata]|uniref:uncharacterized protein n=1 Tax=Aegilops tauschii subsp. strangulata TaxID=200361 RepID=UPI003CC88427
MDTNPLATPDTSDDDASAPAASAPPPSALAHAPPASAPLSTAPDAFPSTVLQTIDIRHHIPVTLDLHAGNYAQWRRFFLTIVGMFGVRDHLVAPAAPRRRDPEWVMVDHCVVHWLYSTVSPELLDAVMQPDDTADVLWAAIEGIFRDNNLSRAVYLDAEYHAMVQGDLTVMQYCTRLKSFADQLRDLGQPVSEPQQLFNMLRGLGRQYHTAIPHLTSRVPLPTFLEARSFLLEEHHAEQAARQQSAHALIAARPPVSPAPPTPPSNGGAGRGRGRNRRRGRGKGGLVFGSTTLDSARAGVLGPRPGVPTQQALFAGGAPAAPLPYGYGGYPALLPGFTYGSLGASSSSAPPPPQQPWDMGGLQTALQAAYSSSPPPPTSTSDWYMDSGASSHMTSNPGTLHSLRPSFPPRDIIVGNGGRMPITHTGRGSLIANNSSLELHNVLLSPSIITNLLSVRRLTRNNPVSVEFDAFGFSVKDIRTRLVILRCDSTGDLYPVCCNPVVPRASYFAGVASTELWHSRLGHPGKEVLRRALGQFEFSCAPSTPHSCSACRLGKNTRLPFAAFTSTSYFPFQLLHLDVWTSPVVSISGFEYYPVIIDSCTHYVWTFPLRNKSDVICMLTAFYAYVHTQFERPILALQTDNGREFDNLAVRSLLSRHGTVLRLSCPYTSQQNGVAERALRTLNEGFACIVASIYI